MARKAMDQAEKEKAKIEKEVEKNSKKLSNLRQKKRDQLLKKNPDLIKTYNDIISKEGVIVDKETGKYVGLNNENANIIDIDFTKIGNVSRIDKKYVRGATPFHDRVNLSSSEVKMMLGEENEFKKLQNKLETPQQRTYFDHEKQSTFSEYVKGKCTQPFQIRFMGTVDKVRDLTKKLIRDLEIEDLVYPEPGKIAPEGIGFSKLECTKYNRNKSYCGNTIRAYIDVNKFNERREKKEIKEENKRLGLKGDEKITYEKSEEDIQSCSLYLGDKSENLDNVGFFVRNYLDKIKNSETKNLEKIMGMVANKDIPENKYLEVEDVLKNAPSTFNSLPSTKALTKVNTKLSDIDKTLSLKTKKITEWTLKDMFITKGKDKKHNFVKID